MKRIVLIFLALLCLASCGKTVAIEDVKGGWSGEEARIYLNQDGTYELVYENPKVGEISSESGKFELDGGKICFYRRDKYTVEDTGDVRFRRLIKTENRKEKIAVSEEQLTIGEITYNKQEE